MKRELGIFIERGRGEEGSAREGNQWPAVHGGPYFVSFKRE
jgi:hypothetical protein